MADIKGRDLVMAIQALDEKMSAMMAQIQQAAEEEPNLAAWEDELMGYTQSAHALQVGYEEECRKVGNLPPYDALVGKR